MREIFPQRKRATRDDAAALWRTTTEVSELRRLARWRTAAALVATVAALPAACGGSSDVAAARQVARCAGAGPFVKFDATDGFTFGNQLVLEDDGSARVEYSTHFGPSPGLTEGTTSFTADGGDLARIRAALSQSGFASLQEQYMPQTPGADLPNYEITHCGKEVFVHGFAIEDGLVPARLLHLIDVLNRLVEPEVENALKREDG
jgi:hypothetical protein